MKKIFLVLIILSLVLSLSTPSLCQEEEVKDSITKLYESVQSGNEENFMSLLTPDNILAMKENPDAAGYLGKLFNQMVSVKNGKSKVTYEDPQIKTKQKKDGSIEARVKVKYSSEHEGKTKSGTASDTIVFKHVKEKWLIDKLNRFSLTALVLRILNGFLGIIVMLSIAVAFSFNRRKINWRIVGLGILLQFIFAIIVLKTTQGKAFFKFFNDVILKILSFSDTGASFIFGNLGSNTSIGAYFAFSVLPTIIFFSSMISVLYYLGVMQKIVQVFAWIMMKILGTSGAETLSCSANIFVGQTEAPLLIKPFVETMTKSELLTIMTGGFATVAGGVMAAYVSMLSSTFPEIAGHLLSASIMNAPGAILMSKIILPEEDEPVTKGKVKVELPITDANIVDAAANGAGQGLHLALNVGAMLLAFIALIAMINFGLNKMGDLIFRNHTIQAKQIENWDLLMEKLQAHSTPDVQKVYDMIGDQNQDLINEWQKGTEPDEATKQSIIAGLNNILKSPDFYDEKTFEGKDFNAEGEELKPEVDGMIKSFKKQEISKGRLKQLNRYLMQSIFSGKILKKDQRLSLGILLGWIFSPIAFVMGVPWKDCQVIGGLLGKRLAINEFVTYAELADMLRRGVKLDPKSVVIVTYAMCGFANFSSIAIQIGGIGGIAPSRRSDLAKLGIYGVIAGTLACFQSASIAGMLASETRLKVTKPPGSENATSVIVEKVSYDSRRYDFNEFVESKMDNGSWKLEVGNWRSDVGSLKSEVRNWKLDDGRKNTEDGYRKMEGEYWNVETASSQNTFNDNDMKVSYHKPAEVILNKSQHSIKSTAKNKSPGVFPDSNRKEITLNFNHSPYRYRADRTIMT